MFDPLKNSKQYSSVGEYVYSEIKKRIFNWTLKPGQRISEAEMSNLLNVSRTPVRESFIRLKREGMVEILSQRGTFISKIDIDEVEEGVFIRMNLEREVVRLISGKLSDEYIKKYEENLKNQLDALNEKDYNKFYRYDVEFHKYFFLACEKETTWRFIQQSNSHYERVRVLTLLSIEKFQKIYDAHVDLLKAVIEGRSEDAANMIEGHLSMMSGELEMYKINHPEYFI